MSSAIDPFTDDFPGPVLALDVGDQRLGVALLQHNGKLPEPLKTLQRGQGDWNELQRFHKLHQVHGFWVGLPLMPSGDESEQCEKVRRYIKGLRKRFPYCWIGLVDERGTSQDADLAMGDRDLNFASWKQQRDAEAAAAIARIGIEAGLLERIKPLSTESS
jgi:putative Holliday junction resolvase